MFRVVDSVRELYAPLIKYIGVQIGMWVWRVVPTPLSEQYTMTQYEEIYKDK